MRSGRDPVESVRGEDFCANAHAANLARPRLNYPTPTRAWCPRARFSSGGSAGATALRNMVVT